jgi:hypothetical protein
MSQILIISSPSHEVTRTLYRDPIPLHMVPKKLLSCLLLPAAHFVITTSPNLVSRTSFATSPHHVPLKKFVNSFTQPHAHLLFDSSLLFHSTSQIHYIHVATHCLS